MKDTTALLVDFFAQDDLARLTADAVELLDCPLMVIDDAFRVAAHYAPPGFTDPLFDRAVQQGVITYEAGAIISRSPALSAGTPDYVEVADSTRCRRFAPLISAGVRLGYLICVDIGGHLADIPAETFRTVETVLAKQLFVEEFHLKVVISESITDLYDLPALYRTAREALDLVTETDFRGGSVYHVEQLRTSLMLTAARRYRSLILPQVKALAACDSEKGSQYCETLYYYLTCGRSLKDTCAALFTHRNTVLYRIHKMREDFAVPLDDPAFHTVLLSAALTLLDSKGTAFSIDDPERTISTSQ